MIGGQEKGGQLWIQVSGDLLNASLHFEDHASPHLRTTMSLVTKVRFSRKIRAIESKPVDFRSSLQMMPGSYLVCPIVRAVDSTTDKNPLTN